VEVRILACRQSAVRAATAESDTVQVEYGLDEGARGSQESVGVSALDPPHCSADGPSVV
jgi:hypothetical protein